jgi:segregation and condensation protein A
MDADDLLEKIELLIQQAEQGEIDPWDVKVIEVIDEYLELMAPSASSRDYEADLSQSGQAFLSASMLVLFKANSLMQMQSALDEPELVIDDALFEPEDALPYQNSRLPLEKHLRRRPAAMPPPKRRVTLQELIEQLQIMANQLKKVQRAPKTVRVRRQPSIQTMRAALELAHQENLTEVAGELEQLLYSWSEKLDLEEKYLNLEQLVEIWSKTQASTVDNSHHSPNSHLVGVFWALLLLSAQSKVELFQEGFYTEIKIRLLTTANGTSKHVEQSLN